ncbi:MAG: nucleotidyl transferase AbiEii/AbiGii toxin family protein [Chlorobium sp.]|nr:nucleotidyl transferase AbiEii/AbiGii toxin family protein [Chlorobium sp.]
MVLFLYGGTAIALRLGHRPSVDFDFFLKKRSIVMRSILLFRLWL